MKKDSKKILVVGSVNMDMVVQTARIPAPGETLLGGVFNRFNGGKGANQAMAARKLYPATFMCAGLGDDSLGADYLKYFKAKGLDVSLVKKFKGAHTGVAVIMVGKNGENAISVAPGANSLLTSQDMAKIDFKKFSYAVFQLETPLDTVAEGLKRAKEAGAVTILTPAPAVLLPKAMLANIDYIVPNEHEILLLQKGFDCPQKAALALVKKGVKNVIITLGSKGAKLINKDGEQFFAAHKVKAVDTVGAGDCFTGSFAAGLALYADAGKALKLAAAAAALSVTKPGAQSHHSLKEVLSFLKK